MYVCMLVCMYVCMYVYMTCMYVCYLEIHGEVLLDCRLQAAANKCQCGDATHTANAAAYIHTQQEKALCITFHIYICMYLCMHVCTNVFIFARIKIFNKNILNVCIYVCMYVCM